MIRRTVLFGLSLLFFLLGYAGIFLRIEFLQYDFYLFAWWGYIFLLGALSGTESPGRCLVMGLPGLVAVSSGFWSLFELINLRIDNWFYINLPRAAFHRYAGYLLAYGTVIPAVALTARRIDGFLGEIRWKNFRVSRYPEKAIAVGTAMLFVTLLFPRWLFPLAWLFFLPLIDGLSYRMGYRSLMGDIERGQWKAFLSFPLAGIVCGLLWEFWNFWSLSKWIYSVPGFEGWKLFEMPLPGYLGFAFFGLETGALVRFLEGAGGRPKGAALLVAAGLAVSLFTFPLIDRHTVASYAAPLEELTFLNPGTRESLRLQGVRTSFGIDPGRLHPDERRLLELLHLKGLGVERTRRLSDNGIVTVGQLARLDEIRASSILGESNMRRLRVFLKAARNERSRE